jgi:hypothetical protein
VGEVKIRAGETKMTPEVAPKLRLFNRILMSYIDFRQAAEIAHHIIDLKLHDQHPRDRFLLQGLNCGMIVAYCRPFLDSSKRGGAKIPRLPTGALRTLTPEEQELHTVAMADRNTALAHSDPDAWALEPQILRARGKDLFIPLHNDVHAPLTPTATELLGRMCGKLMAWCWDERLRLEPELTPYFRIVEYDSGELEQTAKELGVKLPDP